MSPQDVQELCLALLGDQKAAPDLEGAEAWQDDSRPFGLILTFTTGARLWVAITVAGVAGTPPGTDEGPTAPTAAAAEAAPLPHLYDQNGAIALQNAEEYLAAVLGSSDPQDGSASSASGSGIAKVYTYSGAGAGRSFGIGIVFRTGARAYLPFAHNCGPGQRPNVKPYEHLSNPIPGPRKN
ncbi:hypothetical protein [Streptomyces sp. NBC_01304]|uniref:hypothetical protein n=1 Tax=Streptomyces sp. NBC_01304 TaxID=2903818 RepID=UPI002E0FD321|nr:hypothetical protein OG430_47935 [Streptomyces sp. NBC_01304]